ncbi:MAG: MBL fold metallo-hydrolase [Flavobacteriales bacterium]|jgi:glyoxylase-like metal-dependent hydrolase (beta-lactamase superfamily II)|nr:MBL fold metallo-hydrolase [Flavobacteriales bacterium]|tara:strand:+ start:1075 stop:1923 length:849 start_codon:yes stop_codon:yes gene_type:complete
MKISVIDTGKFKLDGGAMFGVVPKSIWSKTNPPDENNMCSWAMRCLLLEFDNRKILFDTGIGNKQSEKFFNYFYLHGEETLIKSLNKNGVSPEEITDVFFTHLHFDHCGGAVIKNNNNLELLFPNAIHLTNKQHWQLANHPNKREHASFLKENFTLIAEKKKLKFINPGKLYNNIEVKFFHGHTTAQMIPYIHTNNKTLVFTADLLPSIGHIPLPYIMGYDTQPLITLKEKEIFLQEAVNNDYILFLEHDYHHECCTLKNTDRGIRVDKYGTLSQLFYGNIT